MIVEILKNFERLNILKKNKKKITLPARYFTHSRTPILQNTTREHFRRDFSPARLTEKQPSFPTTSIPHVGVRDLFQFEKPQNHHVHVHVQDSEKLLF